MTFRTNRWCVKQSALLEMQHGLRVHFVSTAGQTRAEFKSVSDDSVHHTSEGPSEEAAFRAAIATFVARKSKADQLAEDNAGLRDRVASLESELAAQSAANNAKPNGSRKKTSSKDDAVSGGTF